MPQSAARRPLKFIGGLVWAVVVGGFAWLMLGDPLLNTISSFQGFSLAAMPTTPLSQLKSHAGTGELVRVRATMLGIPALTDGAGDQLALKLVTQTKHRDRGADYVADLWWIPTHFRVGEGKTHVAVEPKDGSPAYSYLPERLKGNIGDDKRVPADIAALIAPNFPKLRPIQYSNITVYTINRDAPVTIFGVVALENGEPVIRPVPHRYAGIKGGHLLILPFSEAEVNHQLKVTAYWALAESFGLSLPFVFLGGLFLVERWKKRKVAPAKPNDAQTQ